MIIKAANVLEIRVAAGTKLPDFLLLMLLELPLRTLANIPHPTFCTLVCTSMRIKMIYADVRLALITVAHCVPTTVVERLSILDIVVVEGTDLLISLKAHNLL